MTVPGLTTAADEDVGPLGNEPLCRGEADATIAACDECDFSGEFLRHVEVSLSVEKLHEYTMLDRFPCRPTDRDQVGHGHWR